MKHLLLAALVLFGVLGSAMATTQISDEIELDGVSSPLGADPLHLKIARAREDGKLDINTVGHCSANWRGYKAYWRVVQDKLTLVRVVSDACSTQPKEVDLKPIARGEQVPLLASWFTGVLMVPRGQPRGGFAGHNDPVFDNYIVLVVQRGRVLSRTALNKSPR